MASGLEKTPVRLAGGHPPKPAGIGDRKGNSPGLTGAASAAGNGPKRFFGPFRRRLQLDASGGEVGAFSKLLLLARSRSGDRG
jgi:hypothetical protein